MKRYLRKFSSSSLAASALLLAAHALSGQEIRIAASDLLADFIEPELERSAGVANFEYTFESIGSLPAMERLRSGEIDVAVLAFPEGSAVPRDEFNVYPFAYDAAVVAVNENNPLDEISLGRLAGIYGGSEEYNFTTWGDIGLSGWGSRKIKPLSGHAENSIVLELFKSAVLQEGGLKPSVDVVRADEVENILKADPAAIAILSRVPEEDTGSKVLLLSVDEDAPAYGPTSDNIHFGDYPVRISFLIVGPALNDSRMGEILRTLWSDKTAASLEDRGIYPLPEAVRRKLVIDLDLDSPAGAESPESATSP